MASHRRSGEPDDNYRISVDDGVLTIEARGHWDLAVAERYVQDITRIVADRRRIRPDLRAIVDRSAGPTFEPGVAERLLAAYTDILRAGDRIAMVVDSCVVKGHIRRVADRKETRSFLSRSAARTWLLAYG